MEGWEKRKGEKGGKGRGMSFSPVQFRRKTHVIPKLTWREGGRKGGKDGGR